MIPQQELRNILLNYVENNKISILALSKLIGIGYQTLQKFIKKERSLNYDNFVVIYNYINKNNERCL